MSSVKIPGPDHPIEIAPHPGRVRVLVGDHVVADSTNALVLEEHGHPPVLYIPPSDLDRAVLRDSDTTTYCPYKGEASYYSVDTGEQVVADAAWYYPHAHDAVSEIGDYPAFYPDRVTIETD